MPRIDPQQLLNCLSVLLASNGGIKSTKEVNRLVLLMGKFSKKLVSKCIYVQILKSTETDLLGQFMADGGWALSHTWLQDGILGRNWPLVQELLELMLLCPVDVQRLKSNSAPKLVKNLSKEGGNEGVRILASKLVEQWLKIVKGETLPPVTMPRQDLMVSTIKQEPAVQETIENDEVLDEADDSEDMVDPLEIPSNHVPQEDVDSKERLAKAKCDGLVFKITVKDGKQVLAKVESSPKKEVDAEKAKIKSEFNVKIKNEPVAKVKSESIAKSKIDAVDGKKQIKEKVKKENIPVKEQDKEANNKNEKSKNEVTKEKSKSDEKERRSSKDKRETKELADKESKEAKDKERKKDSSSKSSSSSSRHSSSSRSSNHKSSSRSSSDSKHKSSSSSRDNKSKDSDKDKDRDRSSKSSSSSSKSSSKSSGSSSSKSSQPKEKRDSIEDKVSQSMKDKDTLTKITPPAINKLGKIPKKPATDGDAESVPSKKSSISIEVKKDAENRPKTVKTFNSQFRSHGLAEEAPPPPSRRGLQRPSSQPTAGASIPANIVTKRTSPPPEKKDAVPEKKLKIDTTLTVEKPGIKLIPAKPKTPVLVESDMFMDAIFASTTKKDSGRKRKRLPSNSTSETTKPEKVQSPDAKSVAPKFYQDTLDEGKDEEKANDSKKKDEIVEPAKETTETNETSADVEMPEANDSAETKDTENDVVVENKKPPGPGCGPNGPPGVLTLLKRKGPKKQLKWRPQESLEEIHYFELDETERVNVSRSSIDMTQSVSEREGDAFLIARKLNADDLMAEQVPWKTLYIVDDVPPPPDGSNSKEKKIQSDRELTCLRAIYFNRSTIPDSPAEPDMEHYQITDASIIPLDDANGSPDAVKSFVNYPWPEPRGSPPHQPSGFEELNQPLFNNFQPNFNSFNNQPVWQAPNAIPAVFNGPQNIMNMNPMQLEPMNQMNMNINMNMNPMPPFQQNSNFGPPNGMRNNFNNNFGNDGRMQHSGPQQNNPNWFRPNGPMVQQNNWRPPMGNNNNRRPDWNPRNVCRSFSKGFCRNGDKCQWLHPGVNCPTFN